MRLSLCDLFLLLTIAASTTTAAPLFDRWKVKPQAAVTSTTVPPKVLQQHNNNPSTPPGPPSSASKLKTRLGNFGASMKSVLHPKAKELPHNQSQAHHMSPESKFVNPRPAPAPPPPKREKRLLRKQPKDVRYRPPAPAPPIPEKRPPHQEDKTPSSSHNRPPHAPIAPPRPPRPKKPPPISIPTDPGDATGHKPGFATFFSPGQHLETTRPLGPPRRDSDTLGNLHHPI